MAIKLRAGQLDSDTLVSFHGQQYRRICFDVQVELASVFEARPARAHARAMLAGLGTILAVQR